MNLISSDGIPFSKCTIEKNILDDKVAN